MIKAILKGVDRVHSNHPRRKVVPVAEDLGREYLLLVTCCLVSVTFSCITFVLFLLKFVAACSRRGITGRLAVFCVPQVSGVVAQGFSPPALLELVSRRGVWTQGASLYIWWL